jgi:thiamine biosynthesis lipoprotein
VRICLLLLALLMVAGCATRPDPVSRFEFTQPQMGLPFRIVLYAPDQAMADAAAAAAFRRIQDLNDTLSDYDTDSELSRLSQTSGQNAVVPVSDDLWRMLEQGQRLARETGGAFDITCGPVVSLWRKARREKKLPDSVKLEEARRAVGYDKLVLDPRRRTAELKVPYMRLDLGAIAKSYAVDEAMKVLQQHGIRSALVAGAGDMAASDAPPGKPGWQIDLAPLDVTNAPPRVFVLLRHRALATSGDIFQHVEIDGVRYSHIVDPRTGIGLTDHSLVFALARDCTTANTVATSVSVMGPEQGLKFAARKNACVRIARKPKAAVEFYQSECFADYLVRPERDPERK